MDEREDIVEPLGEEAVAAHVTPVDEVFEVGEDLIEEVADVAPFLRQTLHRCGLLKEDLKLWIRENLGDELIHVGEPVKQVAWGKASFSLAECLTRFRVSP